MKRILTIIVIVIIGIFVVEHPITFNMLLSGAINLFGLLAIVFLNTLIFVVNTLLQGII